MLHSAPAVLFVLIWSTGFVVARAVRGEVDPNLFLTARFALTALLFVGLALAAGVPWPRGRDLRRHLFAGTLISGVYLAATYWAVANGMPAAIMALLGSMQPLLVALLARAMLGERVSLRTWAGLLIGLAGVALVLAPRIAAGGEGVGSPVVVTVAVLGILSLTGGTLIQKTSLATADLRAASAVQNAGATAVAGLTALLLGEAHWTAGVLPWAALGWAVLVLSGGGTTLLIWMVRRGDATRASALLLLVPPLVAVQTFLLFGEALTSVQLAGFAVALCGVWLARR
jgi:drug/metabolite transporter (DMT)-like permease